MNPEITYLGRTNFRNDKRMFGIRQIDRFQHVYAIGQTGTGKTSLLKNMIMQDIEKGHGVALFDPHGDFVESVISAVPLHRQKDVIYFDCPNEQLSLRYNPMKYVIPEKRSLVASGILEILKKLWADAWGVRLEHILRYIILTLLEVPGSTIDDIPKIIYDKSFRLKVTTKVKNTQVQFFWKKEFPTYMRQDFLPVANKVGGILAHPVIRRVLIENPDEVSLRRAMDERKIILINLSKGHLGEDTANIIGSLFTTAIASASYSRVDTAETERVPFFCYMDEFQNFVSPAIVEMFAELRKFKVGMTLAHQYLKQVDPKIQNSVFGNVGTLISFRIGLDDAKVMRNLFHPVFESEDLLNQPNYHFCLRLMIDGKPSKAFTATGIQPK